MLTLFHNIESLICQLIIFLQIIGHAKKEDKYMKDWFLILGFVVEAVKRYFGSIFKVS